MDEKLFAGMDLHKKTTYITIKTQSGKLVDQSKFSNEDPLEMISYLKNKGDISVAVEATFSWYWIADILQKENIPFELVNPAKMRAIATSYKKTDKNDAGMLADGLRSNMLPVCYVPNEEEKGIRELVRLRLKLVKRRTQIKNNAQQVLLKNNIHHNFKDVFCKSGLEFLRTLNLRAVYRYELETHLKELASIEESIQDVTEKLRASDFRKEDMALLKSIPGISDVTGMMILSQVGDVSRFKDRNAFCAYAGLVPSTRSSGEHIYQGKIIKKSDKIIRLALSEGIYHTIRKDLFIGSTYERIKAKKGTNKAKIACMHKLGEIIYDMLKNKRKFKITKATAMD